MGRAWLLMVWFVGPAADLLNLREAEIGPGTPPGWLVRPVRGQSVPEIEVRDDGVMRALRISGQRRAAWFVHELKQQPPSKGSVLHWSWRVLQSPATADLRTKTLDDSPIRIFVVFGNPAALFGGSGRIIFYSFGNREPEGYSGPSHVGGQRVHIVRVDGAAERSDWREHRVEPAADYQRIWGRTPPPITAIGAMQDTDQTGVYAVAELRRLVLEAPMPAARGRNRAADDDVPFP